MIDKKQTTKTTKSIPAIIFKIVSLPFYIVFNIVSFIFFGMSIGKLMNPDDYKNWPVIIIRTIIIINVLYILPYILSNINKIIYKLSALTYTYKLSALTYTDILHISNIILCVTIGIATLSIILFKLLN